MTQDTNWRRVSNQQVDAFHWLETWERAGHGVFQYRPVHTLRGAPSYYESLYGGSVFFDLRYHAEEYLQAMQRVEQVERWQRHM
jgi:hypothetical protein